MTTQTSTRLCNTGLDSQTSYSIAVDWLRLNIITGSDPTEYRRLLPLLAQVFSCEFSVSLEPFRRFFQRWDGAATSPAGLVAWWQLPKDNTPGRLRLDISGTACRAVSPEDLRDLCQLLDGGYGVTCSRFDIAFDDHTKSLWTWDQVISAARSGNYSGPRSHNIHESADRGKDSGITVYFGSRESEALYRFYDKDFQSKGQIKANRCEVEFKDEKASHVFNTWLCIPCESTIPRLLHSFLVGNIRFLDRSIDDPNLSRLPVLDWWQNVCKLTGEAIRVKGRVLVQTVQATSDFFHKISGSLYMLRRVYQERFDIWLQAILEEGKSKQSPRHDAAVQTAFFRASA